MGYVLICCVNGNDRYNDSFLLHVNLHRLEWNLLNNLSILVDNESADWLSLSYIISQVE